MSDDLTHYGVKGMQWGVRKGKSQTGISRARGAVIDRNDRTMAMLEKTRSGEAYKTTKKIGESIIGKEQWEKNFQTSIASLAAQNARLKSGKLNVTDKITVMNVTPLELLISSRPKN